MNKVRVYEADLPSPLGLGIFQEKVVLFKDYDDLAKKLENTEQRLINSGIHTHGLIREYEGKLAKAVAALRFYADTKLWGANIFTSDDTEKIMIDDVRIYRGGKLARETLKGIE